MKGVIVFEKSPDIAKLTKCMLFEIPMNVPFYINFSIQHIQLEYLIH